ELAEQADDETAIDAVAEVERDRDLSGDPVVERHAGVEDRGLAESPQRDSISNTHRHFDASFRLAAWFALAERRGRRQNSHEDTEGGEPTHPEPKGGCPS